MAPEPPTTVHLTSYDDLSGASLTSFTNPYDALLTVSKNDPKQLQVHYEKHRVSRNEQQKAKLLAPEFEGVVVDPILKRLEDPTIEPGFVDPRHCLVFWARPPQKVRTLAAEVQKKLSEVVPNLWLMPQSSLHMTALEVTHSQTPATIEALVAQMQPAIPSIANHTHAHHARLIKPQLGFDASAIALSFVPATGPTDTYSYHHLRRDLYARVRGTGVDVASRYVVPSAHLTLARFICAEDFLTAEADGTGVGAGDVSVGAGADGAGELSTTAALTPSGAARGTPVVDRAKVRKLVERIDEVNRWLEREFWPRQGEETREGGEWVVGEERGLECRKGALWYGAGGETVMLGEGF
ncbi:uncharacterized protein K452DRAFT_314659 [Aplosporella prunicola CBS 121167]|uniref:Uncharacterized protein n=1 Tax=Aplosporella prunicola CBS 121167 TaxID=1176127 RepID=A0A6A6BUN1_9PEZI|nr:uncharacterized protein K452DRAFT_314659 [Aplosporella prunicola CBS 121167]KAF2147528.1 hypothetical protein K452DRAFT_314659 [Aplosporella prunicola CBS 121167]